MRKLVFTFIAVLFIGFTVSSCTSTSDSLDTVIEESQNDASVTTGDPDEEGKPTKPGN